MTRDEHPLRRIAEEHVTRLRAERAEERRIAAVESGAETVAEACATALHVLGPDAANALVWDVTLSAMAAFADVGGGLVLEYEAYPFGMAAEDGPPGYLVLVRRCGDCGYRWSEQVESLEKLAFLFEDMPTKSFKRRSGE
jgi:hypothetical protein